MESIVELETDKVVTEFPAPVAGTLLRIDVPAGEIVKVGESMGVIGEPGESLDAKPEAEPAKVETEAAPAEESETKEAEIKATEAPIRETEQEEKTPKPSPVSDAPVSPLVRKLLAEHNLNIQDIPGTGKGGKVTKADVEAYLAKPQAKKEPQAVPTPTPASPAPATAPAPAQKPSGAGKLIPHSSVRKSIANHMVMSKQTSPHVLTVMEADMSKVLAHRKRNKAVMEQAGVNLTLTAYFVKAITEALKLHPNINATWTDEGIWQFNDINIGMAVARGDDGLIVPVIPQTQNLSLQGIAQAINDMSSRARSKQLKPDEVRDATFTITNHGTGGSLFAYPVINQPQLGILGTGTMQKRAIVVTDEQGNDSIAIRPMVYLSFVFDHRGIDGEAADNFLMSVKKVLEADWD
jgi:2-oxoglutarate dehydrogenase E2 component (dihydrolipoamide succinyltransferase)